MKSRPEELLRRYHAWERKTDRFEFQWQARLLQSLWREEQGFPAPEYKGQLRGARLEMPFAKTSMANYLTETIRTVVRREVDDPVHAQGKLFGRPRIYNNLLSSQPLCFNLFAELSVDLDLASAVLSELSHGRIARVTAIDFEFSPGRGDLSYTGDRSAFDVYVQFDTPQGGLGFLGIEVKYHEGLDDAVAEHRTRYDEVAHQMGCFDPGSQARLKTKPLQQIWRDHLLVGAHRQVDDFEDGCFIFLYPRGNAACAAAVSQYVACLTDSNSFDAWSIEALVDVIRRHTDSPWIHAVYDRYLDFTKIA